jgi:hypothetical protein
VTSPLNNLASPLAVRNLEFGFIMEASLSPEPGGCSLISQEELNRLMLEWLRRRFG